MTTAKAFFLALGLLHAGGLACTRGKKAVRAEAGKPVDTGIQPRLQWLGEGGYCGEAAIQSVGLRYGAWISQGITRKAAGGELLLGVNDARALKAFRFTFETWDSKGQPGPQFKPFALWLKGHLLRHSPCIAAVYLAGSNHADYDHIVPVSGFIPARDASKEYHPDDVLIYSSLVSEKLINRPFHTLPASRANCRYNLATGGNLPLEKAFGVAVTGFQDPSGAALPVSLDVNRWDEPNWTRGEKPCALKGRVTVTGVTPGQHYALLRFDKLSDMPLRGDAQAFLRARFTRITRFKAEQGSWTFDDPRPIPSNGAIFYRCFPAPLEKKK